MNRRQFTTRTTLAAAALAAPFVRTDAAEQEQPGRLRIGQIGTKHPHAAGKLAAILKYPELFEFVGLVEPDAHRRDAVKNEPPYRGLRWLGEEELLAAEGLRAVAVETAIADLVPTAIRCLQAGLHVHVDKPAGDSLEQCRALHRVATERGLTVQMGYMFRYNPAFQLAHRLVREGWLGEITEVSGMIGKYADDASRREFATYPGGGMFELACHLIDQLVYLLGAPARVSAHTRHTFPDKDTFADNQLAVFDYPKAIATIRCNHIDPLGGERRQFSISGTQGTLEIRPLEPPRARLGLDRPRGGFFQGYQDVSLPPLAGRYDEEFLDLGRVIRGEKTLAWDAAHDVAAHEAILRAAGML
jgi:predicted dehydrogenase